MNKQKRIEAAEKARKLRDLRKYGKKVIFLIAAQSPGGIECYVCQATANLNEYIYFVHSHDCMHRLMLIINYLFLLMCRCNKR